MKEYNVGDKVWLAKYERQEVKKDCPICFGKMRVRVILGDESVVETDCTYCERGLKKYGYVTEYEYVSAVEQVEITHKEVSEGANGRRVEYRHTYWCLNNKNSFATKEEAEERLKEMIVEAQKEDLEKLTYRKDNNPKSYSWHVGYYQKQKINALKEIERCDKKIEHLKSKAKSITHQNKLRENEE